MPYSGSDLKEIRRAEREQYERAFQALITSVTLYIVFKKIESLETLEERGQWIDERAVRSVNRWRSRFCPSRVGLPIEPEWTEI